MSVKIMGGVWEIQLPAPKLLVLLAIADHTDHEGNGAWPAVPLIAWKTGYSERQVQRIIKSLIVDKLLKKTERPGKSSMYSVDLKAGTAKTDYKEWLKTRNPRQNVTPDTTMSPPVVTQPCHPSGDTAMSPKPSSTHPVNHHFSDDFQSSESGEKVSAVPKKKPPLPTDVYYGDDESQENDSRPYEEIEMLVLNMMRNRKSGLTKSQRDKLCLDKISTIHPETNETVRFANALELFQQDKAYEQWIRKVVTGEAETYKYSRSTAIGRLTSFKGLQDFYRWRSKHYSSTYDYEVPEQ